MMLLDDPMDDGYMLGSGGSGFSSDAMRIPPSTGGVPMLDAGGGVATVPSPAVLTTAAAGAAVAAQQQQQQPMPPQPSTPYVASAAAQQQAAATAAYYAWLAQQQAAAARGPSYLERLWSTRVDLARLLLLTLIVWLAISAHATLLHYLRAFVESRGAGLSEGRELALRAAYPVAILLVLWHLKTFGLTTPAAAGAAAATDI